MRVPLSERIPSQGVRVPALPFPSATGVRVAGDTYQWLYVWEGCVQAYKDSLEGVPGAVVAVGVEVAGAGNVDDVVYYCADGEPTRYAQVKYAVDASTVVGEEYLFKPSGDGGPSILQKITRSWQGLARNGTPVQLALLTNRLADPADDLLKDRDARTGLLLPRAAKDGHRSRRGKARARWATHAGLSEAQLLKLLGMLEFHLGRDESVQRALVSRLMQAAGLRHNDQAMMAALQWVAQQAMNGKRRLSLADIRDAVSRLGLSAARPAEPGITLNGDAPAFVAKPRPVTDWQPDLLGVHRAVQEHDGLMLPPYVERDHDGELRDHLGTLAGKGAGMVVVRGDSCTGKTRSAWEAVTACVPDWQLLYPKSATGLRCCLRTNVLTGPTVVWLDNAHWLFTEADGDRAAENLLALLDQPPVPVIVLATMWPRPIDSPGSEPEQQERTRHIHGLLRLARTVNQPQAFDSGALERFEDQARGDGHWTQAAVQARANGELCQRLAAAPELLDRYRHANHAPGKAVVTAAVEARRLGARGPLPLAFLKHAAVGYLSPKECLALDRQTWFDDALAWARTPVKGVVSCLQGVLAQDGIGEAADLVDLSDIIEQQIAPERWGIKPAGTLWQAAQTELANGSDLEALALRAFAFARFRIARDLYVAALDRNISSAFEGLCFSYVETDRIRTRRGLKELCDQVERVRDGGASLAYLGTSLMQLALADETVEYPDTLRPLAEGLLSRACREGNRNAHVALQYFLNAQGRHQDADALTLPPEPPAPHDPAQLLHDAAAGDAIALDGLRNAVGRQNETFHQIAAAAFSGSIALWSWPAKLARAGAPELVEVLLRASAGSGERQARQQLVRFLDERERPHEADAVLREVAATDMYALNTLFHRLWPHRLRAAREVLTGAAKAGHILNVLIVLKPLTQGGRLPHDRRFAITAIRVLARLGYEPAQVQLARTLLAEADELEREKTPQHGLVARKRDEAHHLLRQAAPGHREARSLLGRLAEQEDNHAEAAHWYRQAIDTGDYEMFPSLLQALHQGTPPNEGEVLYGLDADGSPLPAW
ncbi:hypothetical protein B7755_052185 [Streptomyces sp. NBS 14/10]|uniref:hypothetical protein n=1 Tax=Streptomyces sp. NBS 14/10 TaxID=1945643 RepID=UPI00117C9515|nr:hypothetical protein [Streptomyces sp. NBS 14/10]KAK1176680.1 hypothetical protein B7755_052185 [Streptomyces sp. NBS 14/10]